MRLIDADELIEIAHRIRLDSRERIERMIESAPTVDAVEVVRCKDCKYYNPQHHYCEGIGNWFGIEGEWSDNGYCYKGERKEDG